MAKTDDQTLPVVVPVGNPAKPVRVRLRRIRPDLGQPHPWDGDGRVWWARLKTALGTASSDFVNASLIQLQGAAQLPFGKTSEIALNAALAFIEGAKPRNEIEAALVMQMACTHAANMIILNKFEGGAGGERRVLAFANAAARLSQAFASQVEAYRRLRNGGSQFVRVEHVHIDDGAHAVIGNIKQS